MSEFEIWYIWQQVDPNCDKKTAWMNIHVYFFSPRGKDGGTTGEWLD